jgi:Fe-S-cluster containining protein
MTAQTGELHLPEGINYECTGCGKCCGGWSVPMTAPDYERISAKDWAEHLPKFAGKTLFREMKGYEKEGTPYTHAIKEGEDGHCPFLVDNLCYIHSQYGSEAKPSICQLFPYCFNETPSGVYATVSFVSMGVVHNSGKALLEQRDYLEKKFAEFRRLYPDHHPNWTKLELTGGKPITWDEYLSIEDVLLGFLKDQSMTFEQRLLKGMAYLVARAAGRDMPQTVELPENVQLKNLDKHLLVALHRIYFPVQQLSKGEGDFSALRFAYQLGFQGFFPGLRIYLPGHSYTFEELRQMPWVDNDPDTENLLYRYFYSRIFAKLYFGAGFGQLSLIAGYNHLVQAYALLKLQAKAFAKSRGVEKVSYVDVVAAVRQLEKRLGETAVGGYAAALFELLMFSYGRAQRVLAAT